MKNYTIIFIIDVFFYKLFLLWAQAKIYFILFILYFLDLRNFNNISIHYCIYVCYIVNVTKCSFFFNGYRVVDYYYQTPHTLTSVIHIRFIAFLEKKNAVNLGKIPKKFLHLGHNQFAHNFYYQLFRILKILFVINYSVTVLTWEREIKKIIFSRLLRKTKKKEIYFTFYF